MKSPFRMNLHEKHCPPRKVTVGGESFIIERCPTCHAAIPARHEEWAARMSCRNMIEWLDLHGLAGQVTPHERSYASGI